MFTIAQTALDSINKELHQLSVLQTQLNTVPGIGRLDSTRTRLIQKIDSAKQKSFSTVSLKKQLDSLTQQTPLRHVDSLRHSVTTLQQKYTASRQKIESSVNEKRRFIQKEAYSGDMVPDVALPTDPLATPDLKNALPTQELNQSIDLEVKLPDEVGELQQASAQLDKVGELSDKITGYQQDLTTMKENGLQSSKELPKLVEKKLGDIGGVNSLTQEVEKLNLPVDNMLEEEAAKNLLVEQGKEEAIKLAQDHFAGKQEALTAAMQKMSDLKLKYESLDSLNVPKRMPNQMKGKSLRERIVPGFSIQIQKSQYWLVDINPSLAYRITGRWSGGIGWNQRIGFSKRATTVALEQIYGPRAFTEFRWSKGFSLHAEGERMFAIASRSFTTPKSTEMPSSWMWSAFAGIKKEYRISNHLRGTVYVLYLVYDENDSSPYANKLNTRLGMEYRFIKK